MKYSKYLIITLIFIAFIFFIRAILKDQNDIINKDDYKDYLFGNSIKSNKLICYEDLIGLSIDGAVFDFYKYHLEGNFGIQEKEDYPNFKSIFTTESLSNIEYSCWKSTPVKDSAEGYFIDVAHSSNLNSTECSNLFYEKDLLRNEDSFYSYYSAYPIGMFLFIYSPKESCLYIIHKKG